MLLSIFKILKVFPHPVWGVFITAIHEQPYKAYVFSLLVCELQPTVFQLNKIELNKLCIVSIVQPFHSSGGVVQQGLHTSVPASGEERF